MFTDRDVDHKQLFYSSLIFMKNVNHFGYILRLTGQKCVRYFLFIYRYKYCRLLYIRRYLTGKFMVLEPRFEFWQDFG